jgi:hypothetical protein
MNEICDRRFAANAHGNIYFMNWKERMILLILAALNFTYLDFMIMMPLGNYLMPHFNINTQNSVFW